MMPQKYFIFIDETGNNTHDQFFGLGCMLVPIEKIGEYHEALKVKFQQILTVTKQKEKQLEDALAAEDLVNFYKGRGGVYEMKFKSINQTTEKQYQWLISQYFHFAEAKFCCLLIDKHKNPVPSGIDYFDAYLHQLSMLIRNNIADEEFILLPDDITVPRGKEYENTLRKLLEQKSKKCFGIHRMESHSSLFLQMVDVLTGAVAYEFKGGVNPYKKAICSKILSKIQKDSFQQNFTVKSPNYFSVWIYKNSS